jgi:hypothetical protein
MKKKLSAVLLSVISMYALWGCYPGGPDFYSDLDVTLTTFDEEFDFQKKRTYAMPDKIVVDVEIDRGDTTYVFMRDIYAIPILQAIDRNMLALGWSKVDISNNPDMLLTPAGMQTTRTVAGWWGGWWWGGWFPGWGWGFPPMVSVSSFTTGTFIMALADPKIDNPIDRSRASWLSVASGLMASSSSNVTRVTDAIDQAFLQSPYLKIN